MSEERSRLLDLPPVWLVTMLALAWGQARHFPMGLSFGPIWADLLGGLLVGGGVLLAVLAIVEMRRHQTTIHPHQDSARLVQSGIFSRSRNPIYVGDVMILAGFILFWDAVLALPLVPVFLWIWKSALSFQKKIACGRHFAWILRAIARKCAGGCDAVASQKYGRWFVCLCSNSGGVKTLCKCSMVCVKHYCSDSEGG